MSAILKTLLLSGFCCAATVSAAAAPHWQLMARHGECASVASLSRKLPELDRIADSPQAFAAQLRGRGLAVKTEQLVRPGEPGGELWSVEVPAKELALLFATDEACAALAGESR